MRQVPTSTSSAIIPPIASSFGARLDLKTLLTFVTIVFVFNVAALAYLSDGASFSPINSFFLSRPVESLADKVRSVRVDSKRLNVKDKAAAAAAKKRKFFEKEPSSSSSSSLGSSEHPRDPDTSSPTTTTQSHQRFDPLTGCTDVWSSPNHVAYFCADDPSIGEYTERSLKTNNLMFTFSLIKSNPLTKEAVLFDSTRELILVVLRHTLLLGQAKTKEEALIAADETEFVFIDNGKWRSDEGFKKIPPVLRKDWTETKTIEDATILVMISSFRDSLCSNTLKELFEHASNPDRVSVSIILQADLDEGDHNCLEDYCKRVGETTCRRDRVRQQVRPLSHSRGVMPARYLQQELIRPKEDDFCFQIDSHMVFPPNWDKTALKDWLSAKNEMAVFTTYPNRIVDRNDDRHSPARCTTVWGKNVVACGTSAMNIQHKGDPSLVAFFGAGIAFNKCHANLVVPYDPYMAFLFKGEEFDRSARLFTHGYDMYAPRRNYAYHFYDEDPRPPELGAEATKPRDRSFLAHNEDVNFLLLQSELRWMAIMGMLSNHYLKKIGKDGIVAKLQRLRSNQDVNGRLKELAAENIQLFGLGTRRSIRAYEAFSGVNLKQHTNKDMCKLVGKMPWVPWTIPKDFEPFGKNCRSENDKYGCVCQTTLELAKADVTAHLALTNKELSAKMKASSVVPYDTYVDPILSNGWERSELVCPNTN